VNEVDLEEYLKCKANEDRHNPSVSTIEQPEVNNNQFFEQLFLLAVVEHQISIEHSTSNTSMDQIS